MKKIIALLAAMLCVVTCLFACGGDEGSFDEGKYHSNVKNDGQSTVSKNGTGNTNDSPVDFSNDFYLMDYLNKSGDTPVILYTTKDDKLSKDSIVDTFYVFKNGKCRTFKNYYSVELSLKAPKVTLGDLAKMTDEEIISALQNIYLEDLDWSFAQWKSHENYAKALENGTAKLYSADYMDFEAYIETDDSGNNVKNEVLVLPRAGIDDNACVIYYPKINNPNSYYTNYQSSCFFEGEFNIEYFSTNELNRVCDVVTLSKGNTFTSGIYDSLYYGYSGKHGYYTGNNNLIFFRHPNAYVLNVKLDEIDSKNIIYVDPTREQLESLSDKHFYAYYNSFKTVSELGYSS